VLQDVGLFPHLTVFDNVAVVPRLLRWDEPRIAARVRELLQLVDLEPSEYEARPPQALSGGQRQRVGVARALAADPPILLMDEPFGALDPVTRSELHREFRRIQSEVRKTIVIVTHDMAEAMALATRIGVLSDGVLIALDAPTAIARSRDERVRGMLEPLVEASAALQRSPER
jgi:osmoprotectant transport system ATP-binding protein